MIPTGLISSPGSVVRQVDSTSFSVRMSQSSGYAAGSIGANVSAVAPSRLESLMLKRSITHCSPSGPTACTCTSKRAFWPPCTSTEMVTQRACSGMV